MPSSNAALRLPDVHDDELPDDPADPCPGCSRATLEDNVCSLCFAEFCERCGKVEVTGVSACCDGCAPVYTVETDNGWRYATRSLRRAWEALAFLTELTRGGAVLVNRDRADLGSDGITDREQNLLDSWDTYGLRLDGARACLPVHLCLYEVV